MSALGVFSAGQPAPNRLQLFREGTHLSTVSHSHRCDAGPAPLLLRPLLGQLMVYTADTRALEA